MSPVDFHLWGFLKDRLCGNDLQNLEELKAAIVDAVQDIPHDQCRRVMEHFGRRVKKCIEMRGRHIEHAM